MTAAQARVWAEKDRVAVRDHIGQPWRLGAVTGLTAGGRHMIIRFDDDADPNVGIRPCDDVRVVPVDDVPIDERHWVPAKVRDQLVRQEAAARLRAMAEHLHDGETHHFAGLVAEWLDDLTAPALAVYGGDAALVAAARAVLAPAPATDPAPAHEP